MGRYVDRYPDENGYFGEYGGRFVPETLMPALEELEDAFKEAREDPEFWEELEELWRKYAGRRLHCTTHGTCRGNSASRCTSSARTWSTAGHTS